MDAVIHNSCLAKMQIGVPQSSTMRRRSSLIHVLQVPGLVNVDCSRCEDSQGWLDGQRSWGMGRPTGKKLGCLVHRLHAVAMHTDSCWQLVSRVPGLVTTAGLCCMSDTMSWLC